MLRQVWQRTRSYRALGLALSLHALVWIFARPGAESSAPRPEVTASPDTPRDELEVELAEPARSAEAQGSPGVAADEPDTVEQKIASRGPRPATPRVATQANAAAPVDA